MTTTTIEMTEDEFDDRYPLIVNHLNPNASWGSGEGTGCLFETYGEELEFVRRQDPRTVWTFVDGDDGGQYLVSGFHFVNRLGYLVSTAAVPEGADIEVRIQMQDDPAPVTDEPLAAMIDPDDRLSEIAREQLGIPILDTRNSDSLDFHTVAVWQVRTALKAAFKAGSQTTGPAVPGLLEALETLADQADEDCPREHRTRHFMDALEAARNRIARAKSAGPSPAASTPARFDAYEIAPCRRFREDGDRERFYYEPCQPEKADVWTLYGHIPGEGVEAIGDFTTREHAEEVYARIIGRQYGPRQPSTSNGEGNPQ
jgi:hypothetical protein